MAAADHILSFAAYAARRHPTPYVVDLGRADRRLLLFGGRHSSDPTDPMFARIAAAFADFAPTLALHEGTPPAVEPEREIAIRRHGEAGLVRHLAARTGTATASMDIPLPEEARLLRDQLGRAVALVFLVVRQLASFNRKTARLDFDAYFADFFALIGPPLGLAVDWPLVEREHARLMRRPLARRAITGLETDPLRDELPTQRIARLSNRLRDVYMLEQLLAALAAHRRVFASVGVSHAVMLEPALRYALEDRPA
jgi:hypothetical protein